MTTTIDKLTPEEKPLIENVISLLNQFLAMNGEQEAPEVEEPMIEEAMSEMDEEDSLDLQKSVSGETGDDKAETRFEEGTETTEQAMQEMKKSLQSLNALIGKKKAVQKSNGTSKALMMIQKSLTFILERQNAQEKLNEQLFEAIGFTDEVINKSMPETQTRADNRPTQAIDSMAFLKDLVTEAVSQVAKSVPALNQNPETMHPFNDKRHARKNLSTLVEFVHNKNR